MVNYETIYIAHPESPEGKISEINAKISDIIKNFKGKVNNIDDWGIRRLGYKIEKQSTGHYVYVNYTSEPGAVQELERTLLIRDDVLKQMTVRLNQLRS